MRDARCRMDGSAPALNFRLATVEETQLDPVLKTMVNRAIVLRKKRCRAALATAVHDIAGGFAGATDFSAALAFKVQSVDTVRSRI